MKGNYDTNMNLSHYRLSHTMFRYNRHVGITYYLILVMTSSILLPLVISHSAFALQVISGDRISLTDPIQDDVVIFGQTAYIDAPIKGAIIFANNINVNAPIQGDLIAAAGGQINVNANISGKIVAAANTIDLNGKTTNVILTANSIHFGPSSMILKDAYVSGGSINNEGNISGQLVAMTNNFQNKGAVGDLEIIRQDSVMPDIKGWLTLFGILFIIGFGILGIILVKLLPNQFDAVSLVMKKSIVKNALVGFLLIILFVVVILLSAITVIGLPVSAFGLLVLLIGLILSSLMVSFTLGKKIFNLFGRESSGHIFNIFSFVIGFAILNLLYIVPIPYFGQVVQVVVTSIGFGSIYYAVRKSRSSLSSDKMIP